MKRRKFLFQFGGLSLTAVAFGGVGGLLESTVLACDVTQPDGIKSFGFYQGLGPTESRSAGRSDGTYYKMPCVQNTDIELGETKEYLFWHGHNNVTHHFVITDEDFIRLQNGTAIEIFTNLVEGHRHALKITPELACCVQPS